MRSYSHNILIIHIIYRESELGEYISIFSIQIFYQNYWYKSYSFIYLYIIAVSIKRSFSARIKYIFSDLNTSIDEKVLNDNYP